jgi:hypothetical protein
MRTTCPPAEPANHLVLLQMRAHRPVTNPVSSRRQRSTAPSRPVRRQPRAQGRKEKKRGGEVGLGDRSVGQIGGRSYESSRYKGAPAILRPSPSLRPPKWFCSAVASNITGARKEASGPRNRAGDHEVGGLPVGRRVRRPPPPRRLQPPPPRRGREVIPCSCCCSSSSLLIDEPFSLASPLPPPIASLCNRLCFLFNHTSLLPWSALPLPPALPSRNRGPPRGSCDLLRAILLRSPCSYLQLCLLFRSPRSFCPFQSPQIL